MRRKITSVVISAFIIFASWAIPKYLEVNNVITQQNSYWLLYSIFIAALVVICVLIWGFWPLLVHLILLMKIYICEIIREYLRRLRIWRATGKWVHPVRGSIPLRWNVKALTVADLNAKIADLIKMIENKFNNNQNGDENKTAKS